MSRSTPVFPRRLAPFALAALIASPLASAQELAKVWTTFLAGSQPLGSERQAPASHAKSQGS